MNFRFWWIWSHAYSFREKKKSSLPHGINYLAINFLQVLHNLIYVSKCTVTREYLQLLLTTTKFTGQMFFIRYGSDKLFKKWAATITPQHSMVQDKVELCFDSLILGTK